MSELKIYKASAGSGKTFKLTEEYLKLLFKSQYNFRHILAVTFTNDATGEMKSRIISELNNLAKGNKSPYIDSICKETKKSPDAIKTEAEAILNRLLHDYSKFSVGTIDSFFQRVIRAFTREVGLQAGYTIEMDHDAVLDEVVNTMILDISTDAELREWIVRFALDRTEAGKNWNLEKEVKTLGSEIFKEIYKSFDKVLIEKIQDKKYLSSFMQQVYKIQIVFESYLTDAAKKAFEILEKFAIDIDDLSYKKAGAISFFCKVLNGNFESPGDRPRKACSNPDSWSSKTSPRKADISVAVNAGLQDLLIDAIAYFDREFPKYNTAKQVSGYIYTLGILTDISKRLKEYADENNIFLISNAPKLLSEIIAGNDSPFIYEKTGTVYRNFMIDEFQDTSGMQWENFLPLINNSLSDNQKSLVVGDVKQSIYRWRNGDWKLLAGQIEKDVSQHGSDVETLAYNWRSKKNIIDFNNSFFNCASTQVQQNFNNAINENNAKEIDYLKHLIENLYADLYQLSPKDTINADGFVNIGFIPADKDQGPWKDRALDRLPEIIEKLQDQGFRPKDIAILVRTKNEGKEITDFLVNYKNSTPDSGKYSYDLISNEALFVGSSSAVKLLVYILRFFVNPDDKLNKAQILHEYIMNIKDSEEIPQELFSIESDESFYNFLPVDFKSRYNELKSLPVFELTEKLIQIFALHVLQSEIPYLQAFQDLTHIFGNEKSSDISSFLDWWDEKGISETISVSMQQDAMRVLTIHKSKGLEFKAVIIPYCNWSLDHDAKKNNILWCRPDVEPFNMLELLPVRYSKELANSFFFRQYYVEKMHAFVDNINLLYVALTRAENVLYVMAPAPEKEGLKTVADVLYYSITNYFENDNCSSRSYIPLNAHWKKTENSFVLGSIEKAEESEKSSKHGDGIKLDTYPTFDVHENLKLRLHSKHFFDNEKKINFGTLIHDVFKNINTLADIEAALQQLITDGRINSTEKKNLENKISALLKNPDVQPWFNGSWEIKAEQAILLPDGKTKRPDRVMVKGTNAVVVDYKSGFKSPDHEEQVREYVFLLNEIGYTGVQGYLWYLYSNELILV